MASGSINVQNLDTYDFYDSRLSPVDFVNLNAFQRQGYPRELLFRLFADYVSLKPSAAIFRPRSVGHRLQHPDEREELLSAAGSRDRETLRLPRDGRSKKNMFQGIWWYSPWFPA